MAMKAYPVLYKNIIAVIVNGMIILQDSLDSQKDVPGLHSEVCSSFSLSGVQAVNIKGEEFSDIEGGEDPVPMTVVGIKAEHEVSCMSPLCPLLGISEAHPELPVLFLICIFHTKLLQSGEWRYFFVSPL
jgi:hypothetical protein